MGHEIRPIDNEEMAAFARAGELSFGAQATDDHVAQYRAALEPQRTLAAFERGRIVGTAATMSMELTVPGPATLPLAGVALLGVLPTHRRRGLGTELMARTLDDARERGEPLAGLTASEGTIYGRFGFGPATTGVAVEVERAGARSRPAAGLRGLNAMAGPSGEIRILDPDEMGTVLPAVHDRFRRRQPGEVSRTPGFWEALLIDPEHDRDGAGPRFAAVHLPGGQAGPERDEPDGYVAYRVRQEWPDSGIPAFELRVQEVVATTPEAEAALWRFCLETDLVRTVTAPNLAVDAPLRWMLDDLRQVQVRAVHDQLWVRLIDPARALTTRSYAAAGRVVVEVADRFAPGTAGRWRLEAGPDGAECHRTTADSPELALDVADLGAAYLGGVTLSTLARAGRVIELAPGAVVTASTMFATDTAPWTVTDF